VVLISSSINERDQMLFISMDEGASFQRQPVSFTMETLLFHPSEEDKLLAYSKEAKLYVSADLGHRWTLLQERVTKDRLFWSLSVSVSGVDVDSDLVHMEMQDTSGGYLYVTCLIQNCSDKMVTAQFLGKIDPNSLAVRKDYIFVKVTTGNRTKHYVSYRRNEFIQMRFPKYALPKVYEELSTAHGVCVAAPAGAQRRVCELWDCAPSPGASAQMPESELTELSCYRQLRVVGAGMYSLKETRKSLQQCV
ncbi:hypothetical protein P4O66_008786, partial [Electrophorus voltai]